MRVRLPPSLLPASRAGTAPSLAPAGVEDSFVVAKRQRGNFLEHDMHTRRTFLRRALAAMAAGVSTDLLLPSTKVYSHASSGRRRGRSAARGTSGVPNATHDVGPLESPCTIRPLACPAMLAWGFSRG